MKNDLRKADVVNAIRKAGAHLEFHYCDGRRVLVMPALGELAVDGRTFNSVIKMPSCKVFRKETNSGLVFEYKLV